MTDHPTFDERMADIDQNIQRIKAEIGREEAAFEPPTTSAQQRQIK